MLTEIAIECRIELSITINFPMTNFQPQIAFWSLIPIALAYGSWNKYGPFDNGTHDSPMIMHQMTFALVLTVVFLFTGRSYLKSQKRRKGRRTRLSLIHWCMSASGLIFLWLYGFLRIELNLGEELAKIVGDGRFDLVHASLIGLIFISQLLNQ